MSDYSRDSTYTPYFPVPTPALRKVVAQAMATPEKEIVQNTTPKKKDHTPASNRLHELDLYRVADDLRRAHPNTKLYTLVYACKDYHATPFPYVYLVQKPADCKLHPGLYNFPGGKIDMVPSDQHTDPKVLMPEKPERGALRELQEETGLVGTFPLLVGLIAPPPICDEFKEAQRSGKAVVDWSPYLVYCFKAIITGSTAPNEETVMRKITDNFQWKDTVPNIPLLAALFHANVQGWILQEPDQTLHHYEGQIVFTHPDNPYKGYVS